MMIQRNFHAGLVVLGLVGAASAFAQHHHKRRCCLSALELSPLFPRNQYNAPTVVVSSTRHSSSSLPDGSSPTCHFHDTTTSSSNTNTRMQPRLLSRREVVSMSFLIAGVVRTIQPEQALAAPTRSSRIPPDTAFANLLRAREELIVAAKTYLIGGDYEGLRAFLESDDASHINSFEENATALLESKRLDVESKKEIGTIRRYGVGADVMIMYGGLRAELEEDPADWREVQKYWTRTLDSLDEVIAICRSNGF